MQQRGRHGCSGEHWEVASFTPEHFTRSLMTCVTLLLHAMPATKGCGQGNEAIASCKRASCRRRGTAGGAQGCIKSVAGLLPCAQTESETVHGRSTTRLLLRALPPWGPVLMQPLPAWRI